MAPVSQKIPKTHRKKSSRNIKGLAFNLWDLKTCTKFIRSNALIKIHWILGMSHGEPLAVASVLGLATLDHFFNARLTFSLAWPNEAS